MAKVSKETLLFSSIKSLIQEAQKAVVRNVNTTMLLTYFHIGRMIVEEEQKGKNRAAYATETLKQLSKYLIKEFGKGYSYTNLEYIRKFYLIYQNRIPQSLIEELTVTSNNKKTQSAIEESTRTKKSASAMRKSEIAQSLIVQFEKPFVLSWTHYIQLLKIADEDERSFYEIEAANNNWSVRELQRQYNAALYERVALSRDKKGVKDLATKGQVIEKPTDALKSHYVLEFLDLKEDNRYSETDLETASFISPNISSFRRFRISQLFFPLSFFAYLL